MTTGDGTTPTTSGALPAGLSRIPHYEIRVNGRLESRWAAWFDGLTLTTAADGTTVIRGSVVDQAALHGLLQKLRDIGIPLVSLTQLPPDAATDLPDLRNDPIPHNPSGATP
ncbi:MAG: hypothetical protein JWM47_1582 [Acidimicrobiales bacterium]|nr:hypothetical protein [Acidimicrobiales bacterium]